MLNVRDRTELLNIETAKWKFSLLDSCAHRVDDHVCILVVHFLLNFTRQRRLLDNHMHRIFDFVHLYKSRSFGTHVSLVNLLKHKTKYDGQWCERSNKNWLKKTLFGGPFGKRDLKQFGEYIENHNIYRQDGQSDRHVLNSCFDGNCDDIFRLLTQQMSCQETSVKAEKWKQKRTKL